MPNLHISHFPCTFSCRILTPLSPPPQPEGGDDAPPGGLTDADIDTNWDEAIESFDGMELPEELLRGIYAYGFEKPSAIQQRAIKPTILGRDLIAQAQSGTVRTYFCQRTCYVQVLLGRCWRLGRLIWVGRKRREAKGEGMKSTINTSPFESEKSHPRRV